LVRNTASSISLYKGRRTGDRDPGDKVVTRVGIATNKVFQPTDATTPVLTLGPVDPVP